VTIVLETVTRTALLGVRFWDRVSGRAIGDALELVELSSGRSASVGPSAVFAFHDLPGLSASAFGSGGPAFWASPPERAPLTFQVTDTAGRFLPFTFGAELPVQGLFTEDCGLVSSPPDPIGAIPLFSAPSRVARSGIARVSADLWDAAADAPAANGVLEVTTADGVVSRGVADTAGRVVVLFAYPEPPWHGASPPPGSKSLSNQTWPLTLTARYEPAAVTGDPPDLCAVLTQSAATLLAAASPATPLDPQTLAFGRELALKTPGHSELLVLPA
jgi:hypothetical protein